MNVKFEDYIIATLAQWAGDIDTITSIKESNEFKKENSVQQETINNAFSQIKRHAKKYQAVIKKLYKDKNELTQVIIKTKHIRGVVTCLSEYEFSLRAYLYDLSWETGLFENLKTIQKKYKSLENVPINLPSDKTQKVIDTNSVVFIYTHSPYMHVTISDMGLIEALLIWTKKNKQNFPLIKNLYENLLNEIDPTGNS